MDYAIKKSTTPLIKPLKQKHMNTLCEITYHREIHNLFRALGRSMREPNWIVVLKSLILMHILIREGNTEGVMRELIEYPDLIDAKDFRDKSMNALSVAQSKNIRHYSLYLKEKVEGFQRIKIDFVRSKAEVISKFRTAAVDNPFLDQLTYLQKQIQALLECSFYADEIDNVVTLQAFRLLVGDMMSLFHIMNEGVIRLLSGYFDLQKAEAKRGLAIYKTFATQTTKTVEFFEIARKLRDSLGVDVPKFKHAPLSLAGALEEYLNASDFDVQQQQFQAKKQGTQSEAPKKPFDSAKQPNIAAQPSTGTSNAPAKGPDLLVDFFASTDNNDAYSFNMPTVNTWAPSGMALSGSNQGYAFSSGGTSPTGNPFAQQGMSQPPGGFAGYNPGNSTAQFGQNGSSGFNSTPQYGQNGFNSNFGTPLQQSAGSAQFSQPITAAPVDPSFTVDNVFGSSGTGPLPTTGSANPFGSAPAAPTANPFGAAPPVPAIPNTASNNPFGSAPNPVASNNPFGSVPSVPSTSNNPFGAPPAQPPMPQPFNNNAGFRQSFNPPTQVPANGFGLPASNNIGFPQGSPMQQQQQLGMGQPQTQQFGSGFGANPMLAQQIPMGGSSSGSGFNSNPMVGQQGFGQPMNNAFNSNMSSGGMKPGSTGPAPQPAVPLAAMGSQSGQMGGNPMYGGNANMAFSSMNNGMAGMNLNGGSGVGNGMPSVQKNNSNNPFFK
ncbi:ANTH-domain-containing protein [Rhizoclosmatium globosum]|uniref:ANTH-domain-containing protein n=1 Tax=Rhizoclosmatium globosum TaxID=329046 RepID=A0A1Y2BXT5_9FUNG|nr:ANTH-domain-containing protein [Rhizoclosmatium globosum]|eukprot:ORY39568.1 ANTH-domain-containing protein [Rhizoclosmatium globosum]